jgi:NADH-quinone oxidoreductase subunit J
MHTLLFNIFATLALIAGIGVIFSKNPIHSVIFLILVFCNATGLLLLFKIELLAMMFIIIYVGAIAVLFLFVVMMLNIKINQPTKYTKQMEKGNGNEKTIQAVQGITEIIKTPFIKFSIIMTAALLIIALIIDNEITNTE